MRTGGLPFRTGVARICAAKHSELKISLSAIALLQTFSDRPNHITKFYTTRVVAIGRGRCLSSRHNGMMTFLRKEVSVGFEPTNAVPVWHISSH